MVNSGNKLFFMHCLSPVHVGIGEGVGVIDMPIMREKVTKWPLIPGSTIKGVHREYFVRKQKTESWVQTHFGNGKGEAQGKENAGALVMTDARMLAFPVASYYGTFAYITCPSVLKRFIRDMEAMGAHVESSVRKPIEKWEASFDKDHDTFIIGNQAANQITDKKKLYLDEFESDFRVDLSFQQLTDKLATRIFSGDKASEKIFSERFVLIPDEAFQYFVTQCCEVTPRIRMKADEKIVDNGALWYEEYIPTETILYGLIWLDRKDNTFETWEDFEQDQVLQVGGNASIGKGRVRYFYRDGGAI